MLIAIVGTATIAAAQPVTVEWDPNTESDLAGYVVTVSGPAAGAQRDADVGLLTSWTATDLVTGGSYCFHVRAYNRAGLLSAPSNQVCTIVGGTAPPVEDYPAWSARHGITQSTGDEDGDGVGNTAEFAAGTHPRIPNTVYLTEGATGVFSQRLALVNPDPLPAEVVLEFLGEGGKLRTARRVIPARSRTTVQVNDEPGLAAVATSVVVRALRGGVVAERTMAWDAGAPRSAAHTGKATPRLATHWLLAEGDAGFFDAFLLLVNPWSDPTRVDLELLRTDGVVVARSYTVGPASRLTVLANEIAEVEGRAFSARVRADRPVAVERAMYFGRSAGRPWRGGHLAAAVERPERTWFVAEGRTGPFFDTWLLLGNPSPQPARVTMRYLTPGGERLREVMTLAPTSRANVHVDGLPGLEDTDVSVAVDSDVPIVVERSMYWPGTPDSWAEGHGSAALTRLGTLWVLAEGEWGGPSRAESYVLVANPGAVAATVTLTALREYGRPPVTLTRTVGPLSRLTVSAGELGLGDYERLGWVVESTAPVAVERSMYWDAGGRRWSAGTNETGTLLR
jgi:hypothetical protein